MFLNRLINSVRTGVLAVLLIVSFSMFATARPIDGASITGVDLSQYALPNGSLPVICFGNGPSELGQSKHCDDCVFGAAKLFFGSPVNFLVAHIKRQLSRRLTRQFQISNVIADRPRTRAPPHI